MSSLSLRFPRAYRIVLSAVLLTSWISGIAFFVFRRFVEIEGDFGPEKHPLQFVFLKIHGGAAFLMMISFGLILSGHVSMGWKSRRERVLGLALIGAVSFLVVTAYLLYYIAGETARPVVEYAHFAVGLTLPALVIAHIVSGKRRPKRLTPSDRNRS